MGNENSGRRPDDRGLVKASFRYTEDQMASLYELAERLDESVNETMRRIVTLGISQMERKLERKRA